MAGWLITKTEFSGGQQRPDGVGNGGIPLLLWPRTQQGGDVFCLLLRWEAGKHSEIEFFGQGLRVRQFHEARREIVAAGIGPTAQGSGIFKIEHLVRSGEEVAL